MLLTYKETQKLLEKYGLPYARELLCRDADEVLGRAHGLDYPLVLKVLSRETHKTDKGLVRTGIHDAFDLRREVSKLERLVKREKLKQAGLLLQEQVKGAEFIVGAKADPTFGKVMLFGLGGVFVELLKQKSIRVLPVAREELESMLYDTEASRFFAGYRGLKVAEKPVLALIEKAAKLVERENISELDFNPVIANEKSALIVDARVVLQDGKRKA